MTLESTVLRGVVSEIWLIGPIRVEESGGTTHEHPNTEVEFLGLKKVQ
jgi:hypothetical protein